MSETVATYEQPTPHGTGPDIATLVQQDIEARARIGQVKYGERLSPHNGRDPLIDLHQELLDAVMYSRQAIEERRDLVRTLREEVQETSKKHSEALDAHDEDAMAYYEGYQSGLARALYLLEEQRDR